MKLFLKLACYLSPETHYYLNEKEMNTAEKYLKDIYKNTVNKSDNYQCDTNIDETDESGGKRRNKIANLAGELGNC